MMTFEAYPGYITPIHNYNEGFAPVSTLFMVSYLLLCGVCMAEFFATIFLEKALDASWYSKDVTKVEKETGDWVYDDLIDHLDKVESTRAGESGYTSSAAELRDEMNFITSWYRSQVPTISKLKAAKRADVTSRGDGDAYERATTVHGTSHGDGEMGELIRQLQEEAAAPSKELDNTLRILQDQFERSSTHESRELSSWNENTRGEITWGSRDSFYDDGSVQENTRLEGVDLSRPGDREDSWRHAHENTRAEDMESSLDYQEHSSRTENHRRRSSLSFSDSRLLGDHSDTLSETDLRLPNTLLDFLGFLKAFKRELGELDVRLAHLEDRGEMNPPGDMRYGKGSDDD